MTALCTIAAGISGLFAFGLVIRPRRDRFTLILSALLAGVSFSLGFSAWRFEHSLGQTAAQGPWLTALAWCGAWIFRLFIRVAELETERRNRARLPFLLLLPALVSDAVVHGPWTDTFADKPWALVVSSLHIVVGLGVIACCLAAVIHVFRLFSPATMTAPAWVVLAVSLVGILALLTGLMGMAAGDARLFAAMDAIVAGAIIGGTLASFRWPAILTDFREETVERRYAVSTLNGVDVDGLIAGLRELMRIKPLYRDPDCKLESLAARLGLTRQQTSELLNERLGCNFATFMNSYRVDAAKALLADRPDLTILAIAEEVGFGNKTSFNEAFRKLTGYTPSAWRRKAFKKSSG